MLSRDVLGNWPVLHHEDVNAVLRSSQLSREIWRSPGYGQTHPFLADGTMGRSDRLQTLGSVRLSASAIG